MFTCVSRIKELYSPPFEEILSCSDLYQISKKKKKMYLPLDLQLQLLHHSFFLFFYSSLSLCFVFSLPSSEAMIHGIFLFTHLSRMFGLTPIVMDAVFCTNTGAFCYLHRIPGFTQVSTCSCTAGLFALVISYHCRSLHTEPVLVETMTDKERTLPKITNIFQVYFPFSQL